MHLGCLILCCSLLSQQSQPRSNVPPARDDAATAGPLVPIDQRKTKLTPPRLVTEALTPPEEDPLPGRELPLVEVLTRSATRARQLPAVQAYWNLACAVGEYHFCRREQEALAALARDASRGTAARDATAELAAELALASARAQEAQLRVAAAQADLADKVGLAPGDRIVLPADEPHVGAYRTYFDVLFASRAAPPRMQLLQKILPLRRKAIDVRAEAVQAAVDSLNAAAEGLTHRAVSANEVGQRHLFLNRQQIAFLEAVRQYNHEIAEYALTVADPNASPAAILPMLIKPKETTPAAVPEKSNSAGNPGSGGAANESPRTGNAPAMRSLLKSDPATPDSQTNLKPSNTGDQLAQAGDQGAPTSADTELSTADYDNFAALLDLSAPKRTHRLARLLHWDRALADSEQTLLTLEQCLAAVPPAQRRPAVEAYWRAREHVARCQVFSDQNDQLAALYAVALAAASQSGGAEAMLDLRARQQAAEADLLESQAELWLRRLELAAPLGRAGEIKQWPLPATPPHGGRYEARLEAQPQSLAQLPAVQRAASLLPGMYRAAEFRAEAVILLDGERAAAIEGAQSARQHIELWTPLEAIARQAAESLNFLASLTQYNTAIADYALAILPPGISSPELTSSLIVQSR